MYIVKFQNVVPHNDRINNKNVVIRFRTAYLLNFTVLFFTSPSFLQIRDIRFKRSCACTYV